MADSRDKAGQEKAGWPVVVVRRFTPEADPENFQVFHKDFGPSAPTDGICRYLPEATITGLVEALEEIAAISTGDSDTAFWAADTAADALSTFRQEVE